MKKDDNGSSSSDAQEERHDDFDVCQAEEKCREERDHLNVLIQDEAKEN